MEKAAKATLRYLFENYLKGPNIPYSINLIARHYKCDPIALSSYLVERNWIRECWICKDSEISCRITVAGIEEINPSFLHDKLRVLIGALASSGGCKTLLDILQDKIEDYPIALDIVHQLQKLNLVAISHDTGDLRIQLTPMGWKFFERKGKSMFAFMAVA